MTTNSTTTRSWEELRKEARRAESRVERELGELGRRGTRDDDARMRARMRACMRMNELERADGPERLTGRAMTMTMKQDDT